MPRKQWYAWHGPRPYIVHSCGGGVALVIPPCTVIQFAYSEETQSYESSPPGWTLVYSDANYSLIGPTGESWAFAEDGLFFSGPGENGNRIYAFDPDDPDNPFAYPYTEEGELKGLKTTQLTNGVAATTAEVYTYDEETGRLTSVTLRRRVGDSPWEDLQRGTYSYYSASSEHGLAGDVQAVTQQFYENGQWGGDRVSHFRYYVDDESGGVARAMKYALEPEQYELLKADPEVSDPLAASDEKVAQYASKAFEYNEDGLLTKTTVFGQQQSTVEYEEGSLESIDPNIFQRKSIETRSDGSIRIEYKNFVEQPILTELRESAQSATSSIDYYHYDSSGSLLEHATPAALAGYSVNGYSIVPQYRSDSGQYNVGLIELHEYYDETTTDSGGVGVKGFKKCDKIKKGRDGTEILLRKYEYTEHTAMVELATPTFDVSSSSSSSSSSSAAIPTTAEITTYPIAREIRYRNEDGTGEIVTSYSYSWHPNSLQMSERVTTLPPVPAEQNGPGVSATRVERFDTSGRLVWTKDERGGIGYRQYDGAGNVTRTIEDVDDTQLTVPSGWSTPVGAGLHVITDFEYDIYGRQTQILGPEHEVDLDGTATTVRTARWTVYKEYDRETWTAQGYYVPATDTYTLVNPVSIGNRNAAGTRRESIQAVRESTAGKLSASDSFPQSSYVRWSVSLSDNAGRVTASRAYHTIPASGDGESGANYDETTFGYDLMGRQNMVRSPGGTITRTVFNAFGQAACVYVGTDDSGATDYDPSAGREPCELVQPPAGSSSSSSSSSSAGSNNMVLVTEYEYAGSSGCAGCGGGGAGQLAATIQYVDAVETRVTEHLYDWRNRQQYVIADADDQGRVTYARNHYDNLDQVVRVERYHDVAGDGVDADGDPNPDDVLIARQESFYDDMGRVYRTRQYAVDPATGAVGNYLQDHTWYDAAGSVIKQQQPGAQAFTKMAYDSLGRMVKQYVGYDLDERPVESSSSSSSSSGSPDASYLDATDVEGDTIVEQTEQAHDTAGNVLLTTTRQRLHNATGTGELTTQWGAQPRARVSYAAMWYDGIGRPTATANYGTNGGTALTRPSTVPVRSDDVLVTSTEYNSAGGTYKTLDPAGRDDRQFFDALGRTIKTVQNYVDGVVDADHQDEDVTVEMTYTADGQLSTLAAKNPTTGDQTTRYAYGTTLSESGIARSDLLRAEMYPDSDDRADPLGDGPDEVYDRVELRYNRQGERIEKKDQNGTVHAYEFDNLGRLIHDRVTSVGIGVDSTTLRISTVYDVRGLVEKTTIYDNATVGSGSMVNEIVFEYNDSGQRSKEYQEHSGAKDANTLYVGYNYDTTASSGAFTKGLRPTSVRYPNGRLVHFTYGSSGEMNDALNRLAAINDDNSGSPGSSIAEYTYLGLGTIVVEDYPEPDVKLDYDSGTAGEYAGFDGFGRLVNHLWRDYGASEDRDSYRYGYDRVSNRLYRENTTAGGKDELYTYDGVNQLKTFDRGDLNAGKTAISGTPEREEDWTLDMTGNWSGYVQKTSGSTDLNHTRSHNKANEITSVSSWATPVHNRAGNMTTVPKPSSPANGLTLKYDAWNRLVEVKDGQTLVGKYEYDGQNRRIKKHIDSQSPASPNGIDRYEHFFYNSPWQILETRDTTTVGNQAESLQPKYQYVWSARYIDAPVLREKNTDADGLCDDERTYYLGDANHNITCLVDVSGDPLERYLYDAFGNVTTYDGSWSNIRCTSGYAVTHLYTGRELDGESGIYSNRNRYFTSNIGRFTSRDAVGLGLGAETLNLYAYVANRPVISTDATGLAGAPIPFAPGIKILSVVVRRCAYAKFEIKFSIPWEQVGHNGWVVQEVQTRTRIFDCQRNDITGKYDVRDAHFWEAFDLGNIWLRKNVGDPDDTFEFGGDLHNTRGTHTVSGTAKGAGNWELPSYFVPGVVSEARELPSTYRRPTGWDKIAGTAHNMTLTWDCCCNKECTLLYTTPPWAITVPTPGEDCPTQIPTYLDDPHTPFPLWPNSPRNRGCN